MGFSLVIASLRTVAACLAPVGATIAAVTAVWAHPHVLVDAKAEIVFDDRQRISAVRNIWQFDPAFSAFAIQGLDKDGDGKLNDAELAPLAQENVESLARYDFFTYLVAGERKHVFLPPKEYRDEFDDGRLTLTFTLPLDEPVAVNGTVKVEIFDPEYFVAITLVADHPVRLDGAPSSCRATYRPPHELDASTMTALAAIPIDQHDLPPDLLDAASALSNLIQVSCPAPAVATAKSGPPMSRSAPADFMSTASGLPQAGNTATQTAANDDGDQSPPTYRARAASAAAKSPLSPVMFIGLLMVLVTCLAVCSVLLLRRLRSAR
jgi:ABC-type uncharacterized transport system substrate-binding protein